MKSNIKYVYFIITILLFYNSCRYSSKEEKEKDNLTILKKINFDILDSLSGDSIKYKLNHSNEIYIISMMGNCVDCIASFLEWRENTKILCDNVYLYIINDHDLYLFQYYLKKFNINLHNNEHLILDKNSLFKKFHKLNKIINFLITDNQGFVKTFK